MVVLTILPTMRRPGLARCAGAIGYRKQVTIDDTTPSDGAATRRARRALEGSAGESPTPTLPFSDTTAVAADASDAVHPAPESEEFAAEQDEVADDSELLTLGLDEADGEDDDDDADSATPAERADGDRPATALTWLETADVEESTRPADLNAITMTPGGPDLLAGVKLRPGMLQARWLAPIGTLLALVIAYGVTMLLWPLNAVPPTVEAVEFPAVPSEVAEIAWPATGSAGVGIAGVSATASTADAASIASVTKVVSSMMVLDRLPLQLGEQGPEYAFTYGDSVNYWDYLRADQSALDVPVDGVLTEYQLLQGTLLGSANNYIDRLARELWGSDEQFARAAEEWLAERGLSGITVVTPSGFDEGNVATPEALLQLGERAMQNPVFAEIVGSAGADIPGAGWVENTNGMLADPGVLGIKTGTLVGWSLLTAKDVTVGDTTIHLYAAVLNQDSNEERLAVTRSLLSQIESALETLAPAVPAGTVVGEISTAWGTSVDVVSDEDATVVLWNGAAPTAAVDFALADEREAGDGIGTLTVNGPVDAATATVSLADDLTGPSPWWRLTHPLELLGVSGK